MPASVSLSLLDDTAAPWANVTTIDASDPICGGQHFIGLKFSEVSVILPGFNLEAIEYAKKLIAAVATAVAKTEARIEADNVRMSNPEVL